MLSMFFLVQGPYDTLLYSKGKDKVVPVLSFLTEHYAMKAHWGVDV
jgi:hypothetical protein